MTARHERMYKNSPKLERDGESGKMKVGKKETPAEKKSGEVASGNDGMQMHEKAMTDLHQKHAKERLELYHKHEKEHLDLTHKSSKGEDDSGKTGGDKIEKIEKDKKE